MSHLAHRNERGAGDGHDLALVQSAKEMSNSADDLIMWSDIADVLNGYGRTRDCDFIRQFVRNVEFHANPIQKHESAMGSDGN